jgi:toxin ParE1/3/4
MMRIQWTIPARSDLQNIGRYLEENSPSLLGSTIRELYGGMRELKQFPYRGREGRKRGTRELVFTRIPFIAVYRVKDEAIEVLRIWHGAQNRK